MEFILSKAPHTAGLRRTSDGGMMPFARKMSSHSVVSPAARRYEVEPASAEVVRRARRSAVQRVRTSCIHFWRHSQKSLWRQSAVWEAAKLHRRNGNLVGSACASLAQRRCAMNVEEVTRSHTLQVLLQTAAVCSGAHGGAGYTFGALTILVVLRPKTQSCAAEPWSPHYANGRRAGLGGASAGCYPRHSCAKQ